MGIIRDPKKAMYNAVYRRTTVDALAPLKKSSAAKTAVNAASWVAKAGDVSVKGKPKVVEKPQTSAVPLEKLEKYSDKALNGFARFFLIAGILLLLLGIVLLPAGGSGIPFLLIGIFALMTRKTYKKELRNREAYREEVEAYHQLLAQQEKE